MFEDAINYPRNGEDAVKTILIGGVLGLLSVLVVPVFLVFGYFVRALRASIAGDEEPPVFDEWGDLFVDGLKAFVISFVYFLLPTVVFAVVAGGIAVTAITTGDVRPGAIAGAFLGFAVGGILWLAAWYVLPAALANFVREGRVEAAFAFGDIRPALTSGSYATAWLLAFAVIVVANVVVGVLNVLPPLGFVVGAFVYFYALVVAAYLYGHGFGEALPVEPSSETPAGRPAA